MSIKKENANENYLERIPKRSSLLNWNQDDEGRVTLEVENTGFFNYIAQKLFKKPRVSYIHLDETGSFIWSVIDDSKNILEIGLLVKEKFGEKAEPLYERIAKFFQILDSYNFISYK